MVVLFTDFGFNSPYIGQMSAAVYAVNPDARIVNLLANAPAFNPLVSAYLLAAYARDFPAGTVFICVVDPGVGSTSRKPVVMKIDGKLFVGPDNGLFDALIAQSQTASRQEILWHPQGMSATFHGRDLFAPVAAHLDADICPDDWLSEPVPCDDQAVAADYYAVIYIDDFGNVMTGVRATTVPKDSGLLVGGITLNMARTFSDVPEGKPFWYENANGLIEIAVNRGNAAAQLSLGIGTIIGSSHLTGDQTVVMEPCLTTRPANETVPSALRRLKTDYSMLDVSGLLSEAAELMSQHVLQGREAAAVIDELEALFQRHYDTYKAKAGRVD